MNRRIIFKLVIIASVMVSMLGGSVAHALSQNMSLESGELTAVKHRRSFKNLQQQTPSNQLSFVDARQVSTSHSGVATRAIDGNTDGRWSNNSVTHTSNTMNNWWQGQLSAPAIISEIKVYNRTDCCANRLQHFYILLSDVDMSGMTLSQAREAANEEIYVNTQVPTATPYNGALPSGGSLGQYVMIYKPSNSHLSLAEVEVFGESLGHRYYRFTPTQLRNTQASGVQVAELAFYDDDGLRMGVNEATVTSSGSFSLGEEPAKANDGNLNTNWRGSTGIERLTYDFGVPVKAESYSFTTADNDGEDPIRWMIEGSLDGSDWTLIDDKTYQNQPVPTGGTKQITPISLEILMDHPVKTSHVTFVGDAYDATYQPGTTILQLAENVDSYTEARLEYHVSGNLQLQRKHNTTGWEVAWQSNTGSSCPGEVKLDPYYGLVVFDCNMNPLWSVHTTPHQEHINYHLELKAENDGYNLVMFNLEGSPSNHAASITWKLSDGLVQTVIVNEEVALKEIWTEQGWEHHLDWNATDINQFQELFSDNPTDPYADAHRMLASMYAYEQYYADSSQTSINKRTYSKKHELSRASFTSNWLFTNGLFNFFNCTGYRSCKDKVEQGDTVIQLMNQYVYMIQAIMDTMSSENPTQDLLGDQIFNNIFNDQDLTDVLTAYNYLLSNNPLTTDMGTPTNINSLNNSWTQFLGQHPDRGDEFRIDASLDLETIWRTVKNGNPTIGTFPDNANPMKSVLNLAVTYALTIPKYDSDTETASYKHKFRVGLFDGVTVNTKDLTKGLNLTVVEDTFSQLFGVSAGVYGNHEFQWHVTRDVNNGTITDHSTTYQYTVGGMLEGSADVSKAVDFWTDLDSLDSALDTIEESLTGDVLFEAPLAQAVSNDNFSTVSGLSSDAQTSLSELSTDSGEVSINQAKSYATVLKAMPSSDKAFIELMIDEAVYDVTVGTAFEIQPVYTKGDLVVVTNETGVIQYTGNGGQQTLTVSSDLYNKIKNTDSSMSMAEAVAYWIGFNDEEAATVWVANMAFKRLATKLNYAINSNFKLRVAGQYSVVVDNWGQLTKRQKRTILWSGFGGNLAGGGAAFAGAFWAEMPPGMNAAVTGVGAEAGGLLGVTLAVAFLDGVQSHTSLSYSGCKLAGVKPAAFGLPDLSQTIGTDGETLFSQTLKGNALSYTVLISDCRSGAIEDEQQSGGRLRLQPLNFNDLTISSYTDLQDRPHTGPVTIEDDGLTLAIDGDRWQKVARPYTVTPYTMLEFDFQSSTEGRIQAIGFDDNNDSTSRWSFQIGGGFSPWLQSIQDYQYIGNGATQRFVIPVGKHYTGEFDYLFFIQDDPGNAKFSNIRIYETDFLDFNNYTFSAYSNSGQDKPHTGPIIIEDDGETLSIQGNRWQKIDFPYTVNPNTILAFDFQTNGAIELQGIGFDDDNNTSVQQFIQLYGTETWGNIHDYQYTGNGTPQRFMIPVGQHYTGEFNYLFFVHDDDDGSSPATTRFSNVRIYEATNILYDKPTTTVRHDWQAYTIVDWTDTQEPVLLTRMQTAWGSDPTALRTNFLTSDQFQIFTEEEKSKDTEITHAYETIGYMALEEGLIYDINGEVIGEAGKYSMSQPYGSYYETLSFAHAYQSPVIVATIDTYDGAEPIHVRFSSVTASSAQIQLEEWDYLDQSHTRETISYVVMKQGTHTLGNGSIVEVGITNAKTGNDWTTKSYDTSFSQTPVIFTQLQGDSANAMVTRIKNVNTTSFQVSLNVQELDVSIIGNSITDEVGYIAIGQ